MSTAKTKTTPPPLPVFQIKKLSLVSDRLCPCGNKAGWQSGLIYGTNAIVPDELNGCTYACVDCIKAPPVFREAHVLRMIDKLEDITKRPEGSIRRADVSIEWFRYGPAIP